MPKYHSGGRNKASEWNEVTILSDQPNRVICNYCKVSIIKKKERVKIHLDKCRRKNKRSNNNSAEVLSDISVLESRPSTSAASNKSSLSDDNEQDGLSFISDSFYSSIVQSTAMTMQQQTSISKFVTTTTSNQKDELDLQVARFFFSANIPFNVVENLEFTKLLKKLRPGYEPPNRKQISSELLVKINEKVINLMKNDLADDSAVTLIQDGWSTFSNDPIIAHSIHSKNKPYLISAIDTGSQSKTAEYCAQAAKDAIKIDKETFNKDVFAVCTDNENKMSKMRKLLQAEAPKLITFGCSAHFLNLVEKDVSPKSIVKHIIAIHKYFCNHHQPHGWLLEKGGLMPQLPNDTRWNSQLDCLQTYISNHSLYVDIRGEHMESIDPSIGSLIDNPSIQREAINLYAQLKIVGVALDKRFKKAIVPCHFLANLTDPKYEGRTLYRSQEEEAEEWLNEVYPEFMPGCYAFKLKDANCFPTYLFNDSVKSTTSATNWWRIIEMKESKSSKLPANFAKFYGSCTLVQLVLDP
ncbi:uncharacterized protein LOC105843930 [Hydra vulgaris]|uniref:uncharacterized protein LOC105843930 n=1 Tax=Hydra vulgaris TaxID=6087 RepID=UPI0032EA4418